MEHTYGAADSTLYNLRITGYGDVSGAVHNPAAGGTARVILHRASTSG